LRGIYGSAPRVNLASIAQPEARSSTWITIATPPATDAWQVLEMIRSQAAATGIVY